ncbi:MAG: protein-L-isoaspartate(D-aspartate) O-methyltransferase [Sulfurimonadaceae bacterium]
MNTHHELSLYLQEHGTLTSPLLIESFNAIDRKDFVLFSFHDQAYEDYPLSIGEGQTISQPFTVAFMLELLELQEEDTVLDIGCGSGWTTALLAHAVKSGSVTAIERIPQLLSLAQHNLSKYNFSNIRLKLAGKTLGLPEQTFDKILVSAAAEELPFELVQQLNPGGIMVIPIQNEIAVIYKKENERFEQKDFYGFRFVPLIY